MYDEIKTAIRDQVLASAASYRATRRISGTESALFALGVAQVALDDLVRELMTESAEGGDSPARLSNALAAGRELTIKARVTTDELAAFDRVKASVQDPFVAKARTTGPADHLGAAMLDADPWADDDSTGRADREDD